MDTSKLTPEEKNALTTLVRSPGWSLLMEKLFIPQVQLATQFLDRPAAEQSGKADWLRGIKASYMSLVDVVYTVAGIESPFTRHAIGLLAEIRQHVDGMVRNHNAAVTQESLEVTQQQKREFQRVRSGFPV